MRGDSFARFALAQGSNIPERCAPLLEWSNSRLEQGTWSFCRTQETRTATTATYRGWNGRVYCGLNFAAQDYLGLSQDQRILDAVYEAVSRYGIHGAGSEVNGGTTPVVEELAGRLGDLLGRKHCIIFPTGWAAGYGAIRGLMRKRDHIIIDKFAHNCLKEGAIASGATIASFEHNDLHSLKQKLRETRELDDQGAILVVVESLYSMDSDGPDLASVVQLAKSYSAYVLLDCAHDFGVFGPKGAGLAAEAGFLHEVDFIVGSFSKVLATTGGFLASTWRQCALSVQAYGQSNTFSNQLGPVQAAAALSALNVVTSPEGDQLRAGVIGAAAEFRHQLSGNGLVCIGQPSALIPVLTGAEQTGREAAKRLADDGILVNFIEYPAVALGASRLRLQVSPHYRMLDLASIAKRIAGAIVPINQAEQKEPAASGNHKFGLNFAEQVRGL